MGPLSFMFYFFSWVIFLSTHSYEKVMSHNLSRSEFKYPVGQTVMNMFLRFIHVLCSMRRAGTTISKIIFLLTRKALFLFKFVFYYIKWILGIDHAQIYRPVRLVNNYRALFLEVTIWVNSRGWFWRKDHKVSVYVMVVKKMCVPVDSLIDLVSTEDPSNTINQSLRTTGRLNGEEPPTKNLLLNSNLIFCHI